VPLTQTRWPIFGALVAGVLAVGVFWWFTLENPRGEAVPASGGSYTEGVLRAPERINPLFAAANPTDADLAALIYSGLVRLGPDGTPLPDLAERWEITNNGQRYVFHLRQGIAWHDGNDLDAEDVVFTYRAIADPAFRGDPALAQLMQGVIVTARDPLTVEFQLEQTYSPFLAWMTTGILPRHLLGELDAAQLYNAPFNLQPVGTGPYEFASRDAAGNTRLGSSSIYYLGPPHVAEFEFRVYATPAELGGALRDGAIDGGLLDNAASGDDVTFLRDDDRWLIHDLPAAPYYMLYLDTRSPMFKDDDVRRALYQAINLETLVKEAADGRGVPSTTGTSSGSWAAIDVTMPPFDPGAAATALEVEGFFRARDGVRSSSDNVRLEFTIVVANDPQRVAIAQNIAHQLKAIDVVAEVTPVEPGALLDEYLTPRAFEAALVLIDPGPDPDPYAFWHSSQTLSPGLNLSGYSDARIDDVLVRARQTTDIQRRKDLYSLFDGYLISGMPSLPLFAPSFVYVQSGDLRGFEPRLLYTNATRFADVNAWFIETRIK
jgi:peptide/nickel transport system substrate-binding protein